MSFPDGRERSRCATRSCGATSPRRPTTIRAKRAAVVEELPDWQELRERGTGAEGRLPSPLDRHLAALEAAVVAAGGSGALGERRRSRRARSWPAIARSHGVDEVVKVKSIATDEIKLNEALAAAGVRAVETDLAELIIQLGDDVQSHILVPAIHKNRAEIRDLFARELEPARPERRARGADRGGAAAPAAQVPVARMGISGANFAVAETGTVCVFESEGNGRMCTTLPEVLVTVMGIEKLVPVVARHGGVPAAAAALVDRRADEPVHVVLDRGAPGRRAAGVPPGAARQRPHRRAGRRGRAPGAALHPLLGVPERVPGLLARGRPRLRVGLSRADRGDPDAAAAGHARRAGRCRTRRACAAPATRSARCEIDIPRVLVHLRGRVVDDRARVEAREGGNEGALPRLCLAALLRGRPAGRAARCARRSRAAAASRGCPGRCRAGPSTRDLPAPPAETFRDWWRRERGDPQGRRAAHRIYASPRISVANVAGGRAAPAAEPATPADAILGRIRAALADRPAPVEVPRDYRRRGERARAAGRRTCSPSASGSTAPPCGARPPASSRDVLAELCARARRAPARRAGRTCRPSGARTGSSCVADDGPRRRTSSTGSTAP